jgi:hypothetical protein
MDPFIEAGDWQTFHSRFIAALGDLLVPQVRPSYVVGIAQDVYLVRDDGGVEKRQPDVAVLAEHAGAGSPRGPAIAATAVHTLEPLALNIPLTHERTHRFIEVRNRKSNRLVTAVEVLSPTNKVDRRGRRKYVRKRQDLIESGVNLVELDLMRRGRRLPMHPRMPDGDYFAVLCRASDAPRAAVYRWSVRDPLPDVPVPLGEKDPDASVALQAAFVATYDRLGLDYQLPYDEPLRPPVTDADAGWLAEVLSTVRTKPA